MVATFYTYRGYDKTFPKTLTSGIAKTIQLREYVDIYDLTIRINYDASILRKNYVYIDTFNLYYWLRVEIEGNTMVLHLTCDVLQSFSNDIKNSVAHIVRSESKPNYYLPDNMITRESEINVYSRKIGVGFTADDKYLITIGG